MSIDPGPAARRAVMAGPCAAGPRRRCRR
jgi:hypothetical protein